MADLVGPDSLDAAGRWRHHRYAVFGMSYQAVSSCGAQAWFGSEDAGVSHYDGRRWHHYDGSSGLPDDWVMATACEGDQGWAGTYRDGVWRFQDGQWSRVAGLGDQWVLSLARVEGQLFVGTMGGLYQVGEGVEPLWTPDPRVHQLTWQDGQLFVGSEAGLAVYDSVTPAALASTAPAP